MAIRSRFENLQRQRKKGGGRKDTGHAFVTGAEERLGGNHIHSQAPEVVERDEGVVVGEGAGITRMKRMKSSTKQTAVRLVGLTPTVPRETTLSVSAAARRDTNPSAVLIRSAVCVVVKAVRRKSAPNLTLFLRAGTPRTAKTTVTPPSAAKRKRLSCVTRQASIAMSRTRRGVIVRSLGKWGISQLSAIVGHRVICLTHQPE